MGDKYVCFQVGEVRYAVPLSFIAQIIRFENATVVPLAPSFIEGILNLGGEVVPVINVRLRFGLDRVEITRRNRVVVVERDGRKYGLLVDGVKEILELDESSVVSGAASLFGMKPELVLGIAKIRGDLVVILDIEKLLSLPAENLRRE